MGLAPIGCAPYYLWQYGSEDGDCIKVINNMIMEFNFVMRFTISELRKELTDANIIFCDAYQGSMDIIKNFDRYGKNKTLVFFLMIWYLQNSQRFKSLWDLPFQCGLGSLGLWFDLHLTWYPCNLVAMWASLGVFLLQRVWFDNLFYLLKDLVWQMKLVAAWGHTMVGWCAWALKWLARMLLVIFGGTNFIQRLRWMRFWRITCGLDCTHPCAIRWTWRTWWNNMWFLVLLILWYSIKFVFYEKII